MSKIEKAASEAAIAASPRQPAASLSLTALSLAMLLSSLGTSVANVLLPTLSRIFSASFAQVQWVVLAYLLAVTVPMVSVGRLGDLTGRRRLLLCGTFLFTSASALCGAAGTLGMLTAARLLQGLGAAVMMALSVAFVADAVPKARVGAAMGLLGTMSAVGTALGPSLGGVLLAGFGWRALFFVNVPLGGLTLFLAQRHLPAGRRVPAGERSGFDVLGTSLLGLTLAAYALAMTTSSGHFAALNAALLLGAVLAGGLFVHVEQRSASPIIRLSTLRDPALTAGLAMSSLVSTVMMTTLVVGPFYLSRSLGLDVRGVGFALSAGPLASALTGVPAGLVVDRLGTRRITAAGLFGMLLGSCLLAMTPKMAGVAAYIAAIVVLTAGYALFQAANNTAIMTESGPEQRGAIAGLVGLSRNLGLITGASAMGALFAFASTARPLSAARPDNVAFGMRVTFAAAAVLSAGALAIALATRSRPGARSAQRVASPWAKARRLLRRTS